MSGPELIYVSRAAQTGLEAAQEFAREYFGEVRKVGRITGSLFRLVNGRRQYQMGYNGRHDAFCIYLPA